MFKKNKESLTFLFIGLMIAGLVVAEHSPVILSLSMIGLLATAVATTRPADLLRNFLQRKDLLILSFSFLYLLSSFFYSDTYGYLLERLQIKLPFLALPLAVSSLALSIRSFKKLLYLFFVIVLLVSIYTFGNYLVNHEEITASYLRSKIMPGPVNHIRFSLMIAFAAYIAFYLYKEKFSLLHARERFFLLAGGAFLIVFVHIYSVRSGIIALYAISVAQIMLYIFQKKEFVKGISAIVLLVGIGFGAVNLSPTLHNKIINTKADIEVYLNNESPNYSSISTRLISYEIAFEIFKENKLWGCGLGNLEERNLKLYRERHPDIATPIIPHNQFIYYLASIGIAGTIIFCFCFFFPLFWNHNYRNEILLFHYLVLFFSFQTEPMIETQLGVGYTLLFIILPLLVKPQESSTQLS